MVIIKASCDLVVAVKFFLASVAGGVPPDSFWCFLEYFVGQCIALMSCSFNFLICLALYLIFKREAMSPQTEVEAVVSLKNQLYVVLFCMLMTVIPFAFNQTGLVGRDKNNCWIKDEPGHEGENPFRLTFFIPVLFANGFAILLLALVYKRRRLFVSENRFLLVRLAAFVCTFFLQWFAYFFSALVEYMEGHTDVVPGLYECVLSFGGIANYIVWSARPGCLYKSCFCCFESSTGFYTSLEGDVGESRITYHRESGHDSDVDGRSSNSDRLRDRLLSPSGASPQSPHDLLVQSKARRGGGGNPTTTSSSSSSPPYDAHDVSIHGGSSPPSIIRDLEYHQYDDLEGAKLESATKLRTTDRSMLSPSELDNSVESGTPRETWITEAMRNDVLNRAKNAEVSLLSDDSEWDRV